MQLSNPIAEHFAKVNQGKFPLNAFPKQLQEIIEHYARYKGYCVDYFATAVLTAMGSATGNGVTLTTPNGYTVKANVYAVIVGSPGLNKSAPLTEAFKPAITAQTIAYKEFKQAQSEKPTDEGKKGKKATKPPVFCKPIVNDFTPEALTLQLSKNSKGTTVVVDELAGFMNSFGRYSSGKGNDKQMYLTLWQGGTLIRDTLTNGTQIAENPYLSIIGTIQPEVLKRTFLEDGSGFFDRFLICYPENLTKPYPQSEGINPIIENKYNRVITRLNRLYTLDAAKVLQYDAAARQIVYKWICTNTDKINYNDTSETERGIRAKMDIYIHRFALICQLMRYGCTEHTKDLQHITVEAAEGATLLADYFFAIAERARLTHSTERITGNLKEIYDILPDEMEFKTSDFLNAAEMMKIPERTAKRWLREQTGKLWDKSRQGKYIKMI